MIILGISLIVISIGLVIFAPRIEIIGLRLAHKKMLSIDYYRESAGDVQKGHKSAANIFGLGLRISNICIWIAILGFIAGVAILILRFIGLI